MRYLNAIWEGFKESFTTGEAFWFPIKVVTIIYIMKWQGYLT